MKKEQLANMIDHTILGATVTDEEVIKKCAEAKEYNFASVCANPNKVELMAKELYDSKVMVCTVIGFPLGFNLTSVKVEEAEKAIEQGADELDMVMNIGALKEGNMALVEKDIYEIVKISKNKIVKVIIETCYLNEDEIIKACKSAKKAGADFVKTSTGFGDKGATIENIKLMKKTVGDELGVKASGGIGNWDKAIKMIEAGANRIGASSGVKIITGENIEGTY